MPTAGTDGKKVLYNPKFINDLPEKQQVFVFAHEICHVAFEHIFRSEGKDKEIWNIATDSVINAILKEDGLPIVEGGVDIPEAINYNAEEMYDKLLEEKKEQEQQNGQNSQGEQDGQEQQQNGQSGEQDSQEQQNGQGQQNSQNQQGRDVGHDTHSLWDKAIEERKKEQQQDDGKKEQEGKEEKESGEKSKFVEQGEKETFKQIKIERKKQLQELSKELAEKSSQQAGNGIQREGKKLSDIGIATPLIDWRKLLRQAIKYDEEYTRKNARMRDGYFRHKIEQIPILETEIVLDTSGSVSETLLKNFLRECKNILANSKVKIGCFNTEFHGFTELKRIEDIDNMSFPIGGGTDFDVAVNAFSRRVPNKIIFTDGEASMPSKMVRNVIWVVYGDEKIKPKGGKVINITGEQLRKLYQSYVQNKEDISR